MSLGFEYNSYIAAVLLSNIPSGKNRFLFGLHRVRKKNVLVIHHFDHDIWRLLLLGYNFVCPIFVAYTKDSINVQFNVFLEVQYSLMAYHQWFSPKEMCSFGNLRRIDSPSLMFS